MYKQKNVKSLFGEELNAPSQKLYILLLDGWVVLRRWRWNDQVKFKTPDWLSSTTSRLRLRSDYSRIVTIGLVRISSLSAIMVWKINVHWEVEPLRGALAPIKMIFRFAFEINPTEADVNPESQLPTISPRLSGILRPKAKTVAGEPHPICE